MIYTLLGEYFAIEGIIPFEICILYDSYTKDYAINQP